MNRKMIWNDGLDSWTEEELLCMKYLNVCYGKGGGSAPPPQPSSVSQTTTSEFPTELRPFISDIFEKTQAVQEQRQEEGFQPELTQQLAQFTPEQEASFQGIENVVGQSQPLFDEATTLARQSGRAATDPAEIAALMNPFLRNVTDIQKREAQRVGDVQEQQLAAQASQAGAFGGSRAAILEAERQRNLNQQLGDIEAQGLAASFQNAQNQLQNQFGRESASAAQLGSLGAAIPAQQFKEFGALSGIGAARQQQSQRALDIATQQAREEYGFPMSTLQDFSSILRGFPLPATQNVSRQSFSPAQPLSTQLLGLGTGLAGLAGAAGAFGQAGGAVSQMPIRMQNGGYIKLAGGGGLGQMMQEKVKKYAEGGSTQIELLSQYSLRELEELLNNPAKAVELGFSPTLIKAELDKKVAGRGSVQDAARASAQSQFTEGVGKVPGQIVEAAQALPDQLQSLGEAGARAAQTVAPYIPRSGAFADEASALASKTAAGLESFMTRDGEKLGGGDVRRTDPTGMLGVNRIPASSPLLSAPQMAEEIGGSGPQGMMAEEIVTSPAGPSISGLNPRTGAPPLPSLISGGLPQDDEPLRGPSISGLNPRTGVPPLPQLANPNRLAPGDSPVVPPPSFLDSLMSDRDKRAAEVEGGFSNIFSEKEGATYGLEPENRSSLEEFLKGTPQNRNFLQRFMSENPYSPLDSRPAGDVVAGGIDDVVNVSQRVGDIAKSAFSGPASAVRDSADYYSNLLSSGPDADVLKERERLEKLTSIDAGSLPPMPQVTGDVGGSGDAPELNQPAAPLLSEKLTTVEPTTAIDPAESGGGAASDGAEDKGRPTPGGTPLQIDYNAKIAEFNDKDYSKEVQAALGPAPTYEKGEEPDFASQKYLTLLGISGRILSSSKPALQALGDAVQPALKELTAMGKEERKIKRELRTERNTQKRADYQDKAARLKMQRELRGDDIDAMKTVAEIGHRQDQLKISKTNADSARATAMANAGFQRLKTDTLLFDNFMTQKGYRTLGEVRKELDSYKQSFIKSQLAIAKSSAMPYSAEKVISEANKMYAAEAPNLINRAIGNTMRTDDNNNVIPYTREELVQRLAPLGATPVPQGELKSTVDGGSYKRK